MLNPPKHNNMNYFISILFCLFTCMGFAQNKGYFGKNNMLTVHGLAFLRGIPQGFYEDSRNIFVYNEKQNNLERNITNVIWNAGLSFRHITGRSSALGLRYDFGVRKISSPYAAILNGNTTFTLNPNSYFQPLYGIPYEDYIFTTEPEDYYSNSDGNLVKYMSQIKATATYVSVHSFSFIYSRNKTLSFMPLGIVSTLGIGFQTITMQTKRDTHLAYFYQTGPDVWNDPIANKVEKISPPPANFKNNYLGVLASWDLSINYPLSKSLILEFASELRSTFHVKWRSDKIEQSTFFPAKPEVTTGPFPIESTFYARNMTYELRREMFFNNTFRLGLTFVF